MAELAAMTVVLSLVSQGIWEAAKAGARAARKKRGAACGGYFAVKPS